MAAYTEIRGLLLVNLHIQFSKYNYKFDCVAYIVSVIP